MTIETRLTNGKYPLPGKYPLRVINVIQENDKTVMLVEPDEVKPGDIVDRFLNLGENNFVIINDCLIEDEKFLNGNLFAFTGDIYNRLELSNALVINYHGEVRGTVSEKVDCLIVGNKPITAKINRALSLGIPMISAEFLDEWLNKKREEAVKKQIQVFGNFNTTAFSEAMTKVADQLKRDLDKKAIRSATMRKAAELANAEGLAFVKVTPESCEVIKASDVRMMIYSEPDASQAADAVGLHQPTGERPATAELNRFSNDAHIKPHDSVTPYAATGHLRYLFEIKNDGSVYVKDNGKEYYFPIWLSQMAIAYCGKSKQAANHRFYQRYDLAIKEISNCSKTRIEYNKMISDFNRLIDYVHRSM